MGAMKSKRGTQAESAVKRAALYPRVSSKGQEEEGTSLGTQEQRCREYAAQRGYVVDEEHVYREVHTGTELWERPQLAKMREAVRRRDVDVVVAFAIDRLSRDPVHMGVIITEADHAGVAVEFVSEPLDNSPEGQLIRFVRGYAAKVEHEKIRERSMRGRRARVVSGKLLPGARPLYGYRFTADRAAYEVDESTAPIVRRMFAAVAAGQTLRAIAASLTADGVPTPMRAARPTDGAASSNLYWFPSSVRWVLTNPTYTGQASGLRFVRSKGANGVKTLMLRPVQEQIALPDGTVPPLIDVGLFQAVQERLRLNRERASRNNRQPEEALLRGGYIRCGHCEYVMQVLRAATPAQNTVYRCSRGAKVRGACSVHGMSVHLLDAVVWGKVAHILTNPDVIATELRRMQRDDPTEQDLDAAERALTDVARRQRNLVANLELVEGEAAGLLVGQLNALTAQRKRLEEERAAVLARRGQWATALERLGDIEAWCRTVATNLATLTYAEKRLALDALGVAVKLWRSDHTPRYEVRASIPLDVPVVNKSAR
ncbi:MAG: site-specific recombinases [uncultured Chloroflexi bacterium]|uniref:Site-specific recombinases n=1 Tax=uncultured Chloroflexota bacterium TaxID=166587 RepID=A0A6J4K1W6_9CHLR|nr:MAG: site-specific recombinases [uncultured Chloroflexota bacterium]